MMFIPLAWLVIDAFYDARDDEEADDASGDSPDDNTRFSVC